jgi:polysaccharide biosynthesis transport protein
MMPPPGGSELSISPAILLRAARKHWPFIVLGIVLSLAVTAGYTARQPRVYEAMATVQLDPQPLTPLGNAPGSESGAESFWSNQEYFATQHQIMTSRKVAASVVRTLGLNRDPSFIAGSEPSKKLEPVDVPLERAAEILRSRLRVKPITDSRLANIYYSDADPDRCQRVLAALIDVYVDQNLDTTLDAANKRAEWLDVQLLKLKTDLEGQEMDLHDFKRKNNLLSVSFDDQSNMLRAQIQQLNTTLTNLKATREQVAARLAVLHDIRPEDPGAIPQSELLNNAALLPLRASYIESKREMARLIAVGKGTNHPEVQSAQVALESSRSALTLELANIREGVSSDLEAIQRELRGVTSLYESAKTQAMDLNINEVRYARLRRSKDNTEHMFGMVLERSSESGLSKLMPFNNVRVLDRPLRPTGPVSPRPMMNLAFGAALGLLIGFGAALGRELLDRTVRDAEDVEQELGLSQLGSLPDVSGRSGRSNLYHGGYAKKAAEASVREKDGPTEPLVTELVVHSHPKSAAAEAARAVRTNLLFMSPDHPYRTLLVTSPGPAEGKTMVATSIAVAMSQANQRVCLIDCDLRRPRVHSVFGHRSEFGVTTALLDPSRLDEALVKTEVPNLYMLPAGPLPPNPADLMHSEAFARLLETLQGRFDRLVIDSPPVCLVTDAVVVSTRVDATLLVVRARKTRREAARRALRSLRDVGAALPGFVLNGVVPSGAQYQYSYYRAYSQGEEKEA